MALDKLLTDPVMASQQPLGAIFSDDYSFTVPSYQRPYEWKTENALDLLNDVRKACGAAFGQHRQETYFLGSIVVIKKPGFPACEIVDGQQRLTTLTILLALLRDLSAEAVAASRHRFLCQEANPDRGTPTGFRLAVREHDKAFFEFAIQQRGATRSLDSHGTIDENRQQFVGNALAMLGVLQKLSDTQRDELTAFLIQRCFLVVIAVVDDDSAHRIFKVLNTRGVELSATDILKAELLEATPAGERMQASRRWESLETRLKREEFLALFHHLVMIKERARPRDKLEIGFLRHVPELRSDPRRFLGVTLEAYVQCHADLLSPSAFRDRYGWKAEQLLSHLRRIDNTDWRPCLLAYLHRHRDGADIAGFLAVLERCAYFFLVCRIDPRERILRYARALAQSTENGSSHASPSYALRLSDSEKQTLLAHLDEPLYGNNKICKTLLLRLDAMLTDGLATYDVPSTTVEHIVPQNPRPRSQWANVFSSEEERERWVDALGNLALISQPMNARAGNAPFEGKKTAYAGLAEGAAPFAMTTQLMSEEIFDLATLKRRHERLKDRIAAVWKLRSPG